MRAMSSVVGARVVGSSAAGAEVLRDARPARGRGFPGKRALVAVALLALLAAFATLISAFQVPSAEHSSVGSKGYQAGTAAAPVSEPRAAPQMSEEEALDAYGKLPLSFIPNEGQTDKAVRYYAQGAGYGFFFTHDGAMLSFAEGKGRGGHALALDFLGANPHATLTAQERLTGEVNNLVGDDPANWQQGLPTHAELLYGGLWPGIDMAVRGDGGKLKYEFHLKPGSSVEDVRLAYRGAEGLSVGAGGELLVRTSMGVLKDAAPVSYQLIGGERVPVESRYKLLPGEGGGYGFAVGSHDPRYPLVIDPGLDYSTFLGETGADAGADIAVREGSAYVTGIAGFDFPTTPGAFDTSFNGGPLNQSFDAFVTKLNASGSALAYSTFLGGTGDDEPFSLVGLDEGLGIAVDGSGNAYVTGATRSPDFPTTPGAFDPTFNGVEDAFVTKLNAAGSELVYSTFLGGPVTIEVGFDIAVREGRAYVTGDAHFRDFPTTPGAFDPTFNGGTPDGGDAFVTKLNASGSALVYSTFLGGTSSEEGRSIAVDGNGSAYLTGGTTSANFPTTRGAFDRTFNGSQVSFPIGAFVTKLNASGSTLVYSTFLGGPIQTRGRGIAVDGNGRAYVTGFTESPDFPTTRGAFDKTFNGTIDAFVTKLNRSGSELAYSTFLGGMSDDQGNDIAVDGRGRTYVTGGTGSADFPTTPGAFDTIYTSSAPGGNFDAFVTKLPTG
jgi:hypothetical protein